MKIGERISIQRALNELMVLPFNHQINYMPLLVLLILASSCLTSVPMGIYQLIVPLQSNSLNLDLIYSCLKRRFLCSEDYSLLSILLAIA